jgi:hypothetical protein
LHLDEPWFAEIDKIVVIELLRPCIGLQQFLEGNVMVLNLQSFSRRIIGEFEELEVLKQRFKQLHAGFFSIINVELSHNLAVLADLDVGIL